MERINAVLIHPADNVCTLLCGLNRGETARYGESGRVSIGSEQVPAWHKVAIQPIPAGSPVIKYGCVVAVAREDNPRLLGTKKSWHALPPNARIGVGYGFLGFRVGTVRGTV
jgi:hypothetical protein